jgi:hypothetical protein
VTTARHHVLLIGIDAYDGDGSLNGCVNDIDAIQRLLLDRVGVRPEHITRLASPHANTRHETTVPDQLPTLANIRTALEQLGSDQVAAGDRVLVYYSGHGTQCIVEDDSGRRFAREALLPKDKVSYGERQFLFDWEINQAVARIAARTPRTTVILDCCSSAGATRGVSVVKATDRFWPTTEEVTVERVRLDSSTSGVVASLGRVDQCQVINACRDDQRARESLGSDGLAHGELTRALVALLSGYETAELLDLHWGRVWRPLDAAVRAANPHQAPWLFGRFGCRMFGFGPDEDGDFGYSVVQVPDGFEIDAGTLHGVTEAAEIGVYDALPARFPERGTDEDKRARVGRIRITRALRAKSYGTAVADFELPGAPRGRLIAAGQGARLRVRLDPVDPALAELITAAAPSVELVSSDEEVALVRRADQSWTLVDDVHGTEPEPVLAIVPRVLEHYLAYITPLRMARACTDLPGMLAISVLDCNGPKLDPDAAQVAALPVVREIRAGDCVCFAIDNFSDVDLWVSLFDCAASGRVHLLGEPQLPAATTRPDGTTIPSRAVVWRGATLGEPFPASLPKGRTVAVDRLVAIGTTSAGTSLRALVRQDSFDELIDGPVKRGGLPQTRSAEVVEQWTSAVTSTRMTPR